jgi:hypothetical protein
MKEDEYKAELAKQQEEVMKSECSRQFVFEYGNPDFSPEKDTPRARGCDTPMDIISNS